MKMLMVYAPNTYFNMPYLAGPLLKGYIEENSSHEVNQIDLNLSYNNYIRSINGLELVEESIIEIKNKEALIQLGRLEFLKKYLSHIKIELKNKFFYSNWENVSDYNKAFNKVDEIIKFIDNFNDASTFILPNEYNQIDDKIEIISKSFLGKWLDSWVKEQDLEEFDLIGFSISYAEQFLPSLYLAKLLKLKYPNTKIIIGGNIATHFKTEIIQDEAIRNLVDFAIFYEGEYPLLNLLNQLEEKNAQEILENIAYLNPYGVEYKEKLYNKPKVAAIPDFSGLALKEYPTPSPIFPILTSKGCYWGKCTYCSHYEGYGQGYFSFKDENIVNTIKTLIRKFDAEYFYFVDEALPPKNVVKIAASLKENNIKIKWFSEARAEKMFSTPKLLTSLKESGCLFLVHGIESGDKAISIKMKKGIDLDLLKKHLEICTNVGIGTAGMFFIGYPEETLEQAEETFKFIEENYDNLEFASVGVFHLERNTPIFNFPSEFSISKILNKKQKYPTSFQYILNSSPEIISPEKLKEDLRFLHSKYPHLNSKFVKAVDRATLPFLKEGEKLPPISIEKLKPIRYVIKYGPYKDLIGEYDFYKDSLKILEVKK